MANDDPNTRAAEFASAPPSRVIEMALEDLEAVERQSDLYRIDMGKWHEGVSDERYWKVCAVCFAGVVMANRLGAQTHEDRLPRNYEKPVSDRLNALNHFRTGGVDDGLLCLGERRLGDRVPADVVVTAYEGDPTQFKSDMRALAEMLRANGL